MGDSIKNRKTLDSNVYGEYNIDSTTPKTVWTEDPQRLFTLTHKQDSNVSWTQPKTVWTEDTQRPTRDGNESEKETTTEMNGENQNIMNIPNQNNLDQPSLQSRNEEGIEQLNTDVKDLDKKFVKVITVFIAVCIAVVGVLVFQTHQATREMNNRMNIQDERLLNIENNPTMENDDKSFRPYVNDEIRQKIRIIEKEHRALEEDLVPYIHGHVAIVIMNVLISIMISCICLRTSSRGITSLTGRLESCQHQVTTVDESTKTNISNVEANVKELEEEMQGMTEKVELKVREAIEESRTGIENLQLVLAESENQTTETIQLHLSNVNEEIEVSRDSIRNLQLVLAESENKTTDTIQLHLFPVNEAIEENRTSIGILQQVLGESQTQTAFFVNLKRTKKLEEGRNHLDICDKNVNKSDHFNEDDCTYTAPVSGSYLLGGSIHQKGDGVLKLYAAWGEGAESLLARTDQDSKFHNGSVVSRLNKGDKVRLDLQRDSGKATVHCCSMYGHLLG